MRPPIAYILHQLHQGLLIRQYRVALMAAAISSVLFVLVFMFWYWPAASEHAQLKAALRAELDGVGVASRQAQLAARLHAARLYIDEANKKLAHKARQGALVRDVRRLVTRHKMRIESESFRRRNDDSGMYIIEQTLIVSGTYHNLHQFLGGLDRLASWTLVDQAHIKREKRHRHIRASLRLLSYYQQSPGGGR